MLLLTLRISDLRLAGSYFTVYPASLKKGVNPEMINFFIATLYTKIGLLDVFDFEKIQEIQKQNPIIPSQILKKDFFKFSHIRSIAEETLDYLLENNLLEYENINRENLVVTEKMITILFEAAYIQKKLSENNEKTSSCHNGNKQY